MAAGLSVVMLAGLLVSLPAGPARAAPAPSRAQADRPVPVREWRASPVVEPPLEPFRPPRVTWPAAAAVELAMPVAARGSRQAASTEVGGLPVTVSPVPPASPSAVPAAPAPARVRVEVLGREAVEVLPRAAVAFRVSRADGRDEPGSVRLELDYSRLRGAFGAGWASRLRLARVPDCVLTAPGGRPAERSGCAGLTWLPGEHDVEAGTLSAPVPLSGETLALLAGPTGESGDFTRSDLKASYSWAQGGPSGDFTWSYPIEVPDVPPSSTTTRRCAGTAATPSSSSTARRPTSSSARTSGGTSSTTTVSR